jgi:hypothetical protein
MVLRLNPDHPMIWRTPRSVQFGVEAPVAALTDLTLPSELLLDVLARGVSRPLLSAVAATQNVSEAAVDQLLEQLQGVLGAGAPTAPLADRIIVVDGRGAAAEAICTLLPRLGAVVTEPPAPDASVPGRPDLAIVVSHYATVPRRAARWLRDDVPHLLVEFGDRSVRVGPVVSAPAGPCAACLEHRRLDLDPAWVAIAVQSAARVAPAADALGVATAAPVVARVAAEFLSGGAGARWSAHAVRILRPGFPGHAITVERVSAHPTCGCRSLPENGRAGGHRHAVIRPPPTRARAAPVPG